MSRSMRKGRLFVLSAVRAGKVSLDFTLSETNGKVKDHGFPWRIQSSSLPGLYLETKHINIGSQWAEHEAADAEKKFKKRKQEGRKPAS